MDVSVIIPIYKGNGYIESLLNKNREKLSRKSKRNRGYFC